MAGPGWVDIVIAFTLLEAVLLALFHRATGRGLAPLQFVPNLAAGLFLMLALRGVLAGAAAPWIGLALLAAGACHGLDLWQRWRR